MDLQEMRDNRGNEIPGAWAIANHSTAKSLLRFCPSVPSYGRTDRQGGRIRIASDLGDSLGRESFLGPIPTGKDSC